MKVLFVCSRNRKRSPTAEAIFADQPGWLTASAGTAPDADTVLSTDLIEWADLIVAMETVHRKRLNGAFGSAVRDKKIAVLGVPDDYEYMDQTLIALLRQKLRAYLVSGPLKVEGEYE